MSRTNGLTWYALADPTRRKILDVLRTGPRTTGDLCSRFSISRTAVMKHLDTLEDARLITMRRKGRERWNYINATPLRSIYERWLTPYQQLWAASLSRLGSIVEGDLVTSQSPTQNLSHDHIVQRIELNAPAERTFEALTKNIGRWWPHRTYEHDGTPDIRLEPVAGGKFVEVHDGNQRLYAVVTRVEPPRLLRMEGNMGITACSFGTITFEIAAAGARCDLTLSHEMFGAYDADVVEMYRNGWTVLLEEALRTYVEGAVATSGGIA